MGRRYFWVKFDRNFDRGFGLGLQPIWIHKHMEDMPYHFHVLLNLGFWFLEVHIGKEE